MLSKIARFYPRSIRPVSERLGKGSDPRETGLADARKDQMFACKIWQFFGSEKIPLSGQTFPLFGGSQCIKISAKEDE